MTACPSCATELPAGARFCLACGAGQAAPGCVSCGVQLPAGARFCLDCGTAQPGVPAVPAPAGAAAPQVARRVTSVLFGDLVGFTTLSETRDQEDVRELLSAYFEECRQIISRYGGTVEKFIGDAVMAVWGVPTTHEDDAERAVRAGLELVSAVEAMGADLGVPDLAMRVGHRHRRGRGDDRRRGAGDGGRRRRQHRLARAVRRHARARSGSTRRPGCSRPPPSRTSTSAATSSRARSIRCRCGRCGRSWRGVGGAQRADGLEAPLVGRDRELRLVKELFHGIEESDRPALLVVDGEPGVGKTRLGWEFEKYVDGLNSVARWHSGRCLAYGEGVAYYALAEAIRARLQGPWCPRGAPRRRTRLTARPGARPFVTDPAERDWLAPRLGALLGIGAVGSHAREDLFSAWTTFLRRTGEDEHPVVLVIDDAQHADDSLLQFLEYLLVRRGLRVPGRAPDADPACWRPTRCSPRTGAPRCCTSNRSRTPDIGRLLDGLVAGLPAAVRTSLVERSDGIPLFAVETVRSLIDRDLVVPRGGQYVLADPERLDLDAIGAPASLQALIAARLDTLDPVSATGRRPRERDRRRVRSRRDRAAVPGARRHRDRPRRPGPTTADPAGVQPVLHRARTVPVRPGCGPAGGLRHALETRPQAGAPRGRRRAAAGGRVAREERAPIVAQHLLEALDAVPDAPDHEPLTVRAIEALREAACRASGARRAQRGRRCTSAKPCRAARTRRPARWSSATSPTPSTSRARRGQRASRRTRRRDVRRAGRRPGGGRAVAVWGRALLSLGRYDKARSWRRTGSKQCAGTGITPRWSSRSCR